jgi:hypothetical protein
MPASKKHGRRARRLARSKKCISRHSATGRPRDALQGPLATESTGSPHRSALYRHPAAGAVRHVWWLRRSRFLRPRTVGIGQIGRTCGNGHQRRLRRPEDRPCRHRMKSRNTERGPGRPDSGGVRAAARFAPTELEPLIAYDARIVRRSARSILRRALTVARRGTAVRAIDIRRAGSGAAGGATEPQRPIAVQDVAARAASCTGNRQAGCQKERPGGRQATHPIPPRAMQTSPGVAPREAMRKRGLPLLGLIGSAGGLKPGIIGKLCPSGNLSPTGRLNGRRPGYSFGLRPGRSKNSSNCSSKNSDSTASSK